MTNRYSVLPANENQALGIARYAIDFLQDDPAATDPAAPDPAVLEMVELFHLDSIGCAVAALACGMTAPCILRNEALDYATLGPGAFCFGSSRKVMPEKAVVANCAAARELDANGTNFGYNPRTGQTRGEFGHNDFYPVVVAAAGQQSLDGKQALRAMLCLDEIRGRLAEAFGLKDHKIDHVVHGAVASAAVYGALRGATAEQIESAIGLTVAHYIPFRAIRAGHQLSDSKGASAAISSEMAVTSVQRAMRGFVGPADVFRNPQAIYCLFEPPGQADRSPFDLELATHGDDFAIMGMHFKLGLYEHQSAGAIQGLMDLLAQQPAILEDADQIEEIRITIYEPAFSIIGDPAKRDPRTRQSADHSMVYIMGTLLRKALTERTHGWRKLMLVPEDYESDALHDPLTRSLMQRIDFRHGGEEYDRRYPDGIPTSVEIKHAQLGRLSSELVMYPEGHARNESGNLHSLLQHKFAVLAATGVEDVAALQARFTSVEQKSAEEIRDWYSFAIRGVE